MERGAGELSKPAHLKTERQYNMGVKNSQKAWVWFWFTRTTGAKTGAERALQKAWRILLPHMATDRTDTFCPNARDGW